MLTVRTERQSETGSAPAVTLMPGLPDLPVPVRARLDAEAVRHLAASLGLHAVLDDEPWRLRVGDLVPAAPGLP